MVKNKLTKRLRESVDMSKEGSIESKVGKFYIGDPCYVLDDNIYFDIWDKKFNFEDGRVDCNDGLSFLVHGTAYGDGEYYDENGNVYGVDSGTIAIIPIELVGKTSGLQKGNVFSGDKAGMDYTDGTFTIKVGGQKVIIETDEQVSLKNEATKITGNNIKGKLQEEDNDYEYFEDTNTEGELTIQQLNDMKENGCEHDDYRYFGTPKDISNNLDSLVADEPEYKEQIKSIIDNLIGSDVKYIIGYEIDNQGYNKIYELTEDGKLGKLLVSWYVY